MQDIDDILSRIQLLAEELLIEKAPEAALSRKQRKQAKRQAQREAKRTPSRGTLSPSDRTRKFGHKFANETTFRKGKPSGPDPGGALISTSGLRRHLSKRDPKSFVDYPINKRTGKPTLGRYPYRVKNRGSLAGALRQASERKPQVYRSLRERIKGSAHANKMFRASDPSERDSNVERPVPFGGKRPHRPHGEGGPQPSPGPVIKADKKVGEKKAAREGRSREAEARRAVHRARAFMGRLPRER